MAIVSAQLRDQEHPNPQNPTPIGVPAIDMEHLGRFTLKDRDLEKEILGLFLETLASTTRELEIAETQERWKAAAHTLKGSARAVGAWALADLMERVEKAPQFPNDEPARRAVIDNVQHLSTETKAFITALN